MNRNKLELEKRFLDKLGWTPDLNITRVIKIRNKKFRDYFFGDFVLQGEQFDVYVEDDKGRIYNIEMSLIESRSLIESSDRDESTYTYIDRVEGLKAFHYLKKVIRKNRKSYMEYKYNSCIDDYCIRKKNRKDVREALIEQSIIKLSKQGYDILEIIDMITGVIDVSGCEVHKVWNERIPPWMK